MVSTAVKVLVPLVGIVCLAGIFMASIPGFTLGFALLWMMGAVIGLVILFFCALFVLALYKDFKNFFSGASSQRTSSVMHCPNCGSPIEGGSFCKYCGARIG